MIIFMAMNNIDDDIAAAADVLAVSSDYPHFNLLEILLQGSSEQLLLKTRGRFVFLHNNVSIHLL